MNVSKSIDPQIFDTDPVTGKLIPLPLGWFDKKVERRTRGVVPNLSDLRPLSEMNLSLDIRTSNIPKKQKGSVSKNPTKSKRPGTNYSAPTSTNRNLLRSSKCPVKQTKMNKPLIKINSDSPVSTEYMESSSNVYRTITENDIKSNFVFIEKDTLSSEMKHIINSRELAFAQYRNQHYSNMRNLQNILDAEKNAFSTFESAHKKIMHSLHLLIQNALDKSDIDTQGSNTSSMSLSPEISDNEPERNNLLESKFKNSDQPTPRTCKALDNLMRDNYSGFLETPNINRKTPKSIRIRILSKKVQEQFLRLQQDT